MSVIQISEFTKTVIDVIRKIPAGKVATYKQVAELSGKPQASRGVSWILHSCSRAYKLPWHRVLNSQGKVSFDPKADNFKLQIRRLRAEGVEIGNDGSLSLTQFQWKKKPKAPKTSSKKPTPKMFSKLVLAALFLSLASTQARAAVEAEDAAVSPALMVDSAEVPPTSKSGRSWLASSATVMLASDYIYRGMSQTFGHPTAQGSLDFTHATGFGFGFFASNINLGADSSSAAQSEADAYLDWNKEFKDFKIGAMLLSSNYIGLSPADSVEVSGFASWSILKLDLAYMPKYFGAQSNSIYSRLTGTWLLQAKDSLIFSAGHTFFSNSNAVGYMGYSDFKAGVNHTVDGWGAELDWTTTDRKDLAGHGLMDRAVVASLSRTFE